MKSSRTDNPSFMFYTPAGHAYAAGAFVAICHDYMVMRSGRGWFCFPEVNINRNFTVGYLKLAK